MPQPRLVADAFGAVTVSLVFILVLLGLLCIIYTVNFRSEIRRHGQSRLGYFNGPWFIRIAFIAVAIWWGLGEIIRLSLLKGEQRLFTTTTWQKNICKLYLISNIGFTEPALLIMFVFLLRASLQKVESGPLSHRWNKKILAYVFLCCLPVFLLQLVLIFAGPKLLATEDNDHQMKLGKYFSNNSFTMGDNITCLYPLASTILLGLFDSLLICYLSFLGYQMLTVAINKGLQRRIYILILSVVSFLPLRVGLLGFSVLPHPGGLLQEALVFIAFLALLFCALLSVCLLVYFPAADSLALRGLRQLEIEELIPFDDYYDGTSSLVLNQSQLETSRNSDASTKRGSISFRTMIRDDPLPTSSDGFEEISLSSPGSLHIASSLGSPFVHGRPLIPLCGVPEC